MAFSYSALVVFVLVAASAAAVAHGKNSTKGYGLELHAVDWNIAHALDSLGTVVDNAEFYYSTFRDSKLAHGPLRACVTDSHAAVQDTHNAKKTIDVVLHVPLPVEKQVPIYEKVQIYLASCLVYLDDCQSILNSKIAEVSDDEAVGFNVILTDLLDPMASLQLALNAVPDKIQRKCI